jgi:hypothetical protein
MSTADLKTLCSKEAVAAGRGVYVLNSDICGLICMKGVTL